jgi:hypothetical protein
VGEIARDLEAGEAVLSDAVRLRERYLAGLDAPHPLRSAITVTAHRLHGRTSLSRRDFVDYLQAPSDELPFDRSLEGTPAIHFFDELQVDVRHEGQNAEEARQLGNHASATLSSARRLAGTRALETVFDGIEAGKYEPPEDADRVADARSAAVEALRAAWETRPVPLSVEIAFPAHDAFRWGHRKLDGSEGTHSAVNEALASFVYARLYAEEVPTVVDAASRTLENASR